METAAHFDNWQRSGCDAQNRRQDLWPPALRAARTIPGVEYIQVLPARRICWLSGWGVRAWTPPVCPGPRSPCRKMQGHALRTYGTDIKTAVQCVFYASGVTDTCPRTLSKGTALLACMKSAQGAAKPFLMPWQQTEQCQNTHKVCNQPMAITAGHPGTRPDRQGAREFLRGQQH